MQETRYNGTEVLTQMATDRQIHVAIKNPDNKSVTVHKAGSTINSVTGANYEVQQDGSLRRLNKPVSKRARKRSS